VSPMQTGNGMNEVILSAAALFLRSQPAEQPKGFRLTEATARCGTCSTRFSAARSNTWGSKPSPPFVAYAAPRVDPSVRAEYLRECEARLLEVAGDPQWRKRLRTSAKLAAENRRPVDENALAALRVAERLAGEIERFDPNLAAASSRNEEVPHIPRILERTRDDRNFR
jgi:hypothetical protein